jgi:hypothetical protein
MIIVSEDAIPVACYDEVSPLEALRAYISEYVTHSIITKLIVDSDGTVSLEWNRKKYAAVIYLDDF